MDTLPIEIVQIITESIGAYGLIQLHKTCRRLYYFCGPDILKLAVREMQNSALGGHDKNKCLYLHRTVKLCSHMVLSSLLEIKAPLFLADKQGETALHWAARKGCEVCVGSLLDAGAAPSISSDTDWTPLMLAVRFNHVGVVRRLLAAGAEVNSRGFHGWTPLHLAYRFKLSLMQAVLVSEGGDEKILDNDGQRPGEVILKRRAWGVI
ncbi:ankyrin repeat domain-containing protein 1 [Fusarium austroafricanum]|uniref:Ankyrin repeat domain-containing protein 1 n=1 Tax=Fusarium austroafricanum TaxID=2364996 RepID=A0A8H4KNW9_9HYPO|nr:ankyrin repeat domain-containing protein 1 [Fusarium austroafricanum]